MTLSICIPCYRNLDCLRAAVAGLKAQHNELACVQQILLHVQEPSEAEATLKCFEPFPSQIVSHGGIPESMSDIYNRLVKPATGDWIVLMEQDTFLRTHIDTIAGQLEKFGYLAGGPVDTMHYSNPNARGQPHYGEHGRLSPQPGYLHSSLIFVKREAISGIDKPFTIPEGFKMHGTGVLGGESYYGLRENIGHYKEKLAFFDQKHAGYGYAADITWGDWKLATHLYYSGTKHGYHDSGFISESEYQWLQNEEKRFLADYEKEYLK